ncbi:Orotate phosphoribosyltransferase, Thermus type [Sulfurimonas denitrificans DSM 1251]|jgi:orotate phosphoribosyltransferase|uniref:Orotate phosphoribosyltransferase n=1 Tax=Sulfurimonas denitrificans (strain ATCC 33889 / DSM 1251) TaxID=326298 RepID=PYRE_SULDN|nr:orotate phosphoribosyltransferase [Sulfurimonas denitrificans]Q30NT9.1 RecName: Full=Orotate phosphoribosyltransferase; Short=OPRT; Short=OPRTase [Sulfurimonas denitrificans DSM 1251]ABB45342.1 Orotate phosphoribosyltransferase, Thermus type [Sulfurimonas denitrificans DSM 1251]MDD3442609.1 orotate phosphoribosyltransferase [Sulfurimonas denitrificans]
MNVKKIYMDADALLEGHFKLSSGNHSQFYLQSAKVLEDPKTAKLLADALALQIKESALEIDTVCAPALGGLIAGFALASALDVRSIFAERVDGVMNLRRGFEIKKGERVLMCEDIITTGGSAMEAAEVVKSLGGEIVGVAALANRGFCKRQNSDVTTKPNCKLPQDIPFFALDDFTFEMYAPEECPMCKSGSEAIKPGSRGN